MPQPFGLSCALATPFAPDGRIDTVSWLAQARAVIDAGCDSVTVFGTTGEGASLGMRERGEALQALAGFDFGEEVVVALAASSVEDALAQARPALDAGCRAVLVPPPFYFKDVGEEALFAWFAALLTGLGAEARDVILYHIPSVTAVPLPIPLIERLARAFPDAVTGVKDSSGDWDNAQQLLALRGRLNMDLEVMIGDERRLGEAMRRGASGTISGFANVRPDLMRALVDGGSGEAVGAMVERLLRHPATPAVKALVAEATGAPAWLRVRPPLTALTAGEARRLAQDLAAMARPAAA